MILVPQSYEVITPIWDEAERYRIYADIVRAAHECYQTGESDPAKAGAFIRRLISNGHEAMLEHGTMQVKFITNRAIANEIVRHRMASYAQESTRYCNYASDRFGGDVQFIYSPYFSVGTAGFECFSRAMEAAEKEYFSLLDIGYTPEQARDVLPLATKTSLIVTANWREWRHILKLRAAGTTGKPHPMMKQLMGGLLEDVKCNLPDLFSDIEERKENV